MFLNIHKDFLNHDLNSNIEIHKSITNFPIVIIKPKFKF